jgi:hypothetical protein
MVRAFALLINIVGVNFHRINRKKSHDVASGNLCMGVGKERNGKRLALGNPCMAVGKERNEKGYEPVRHADRRRKEHDLIHELLSLHDLIHEVVAV